MTEPRFEFAKLSNKEVKQVLDQYQVGLKVEEAKNLEEIILKRPVTITEAIAFGVQNSEHISYRSSNSYLQNIPMTGPHVVVGPGEDAGVVWLDKIDSIDHCLAIAHESNNHPLQTLPYESGSSAMAGAIQDITCMGAKGIGSLTALRLGETNSNKTKWVLENGTKGLSDYSNQIGLAHLGNSLCFNESYSDNSIVNAIALFNLTKKR